MTKFVRFAAACVAVSCSFSANAVEQVVPGTGDDAAAINAAIARAAGEGGDGIVQLADGTYSLTTPVVLNVAVELRGDDADRSEVVLDGAGKYRILDVSHNGALAHGITFANGYSGLTDSYAHGPVYITAGTVSNCVYHAGRGNYAGALCLNPTAEGAEAYLKDSIIHNCTGNDRGGAGIGGGLRFMGSQLAMVDHCIISNCWQGGGYAVYFNNNPKAQLINSTVTSCTSGGIKLNSASLVSNCVIRSCSGRGGLSMSNGTCTHSLFTGNSADTGGGVAISDGTLRNCTVAGNNATTAPGVSQTGGTVENCIIWHNGTAGFLKPELSFAKTGGTCRYTCAQQAPDGNGNITDRLPVFADLEGGDYSLLGASPCIGTGVDGVDMGAFPFTAVTEPRCSFVYQLVDGLAPVTATFVAKVEVAAATGYIWDFGDGSAADTTSGAEASHEYKLPGNYDVTLTVMTADNPLVFTVKRAVNLGAKEVYVDKNGSNKFPYATPETAASDLATAVSALVLVEGEVGKVHLADDTYFVTEPIALRQPIELIGNDADPSKVVLDGGRARRVIYTKHAKAFVHGVTIQNGNVSGGGEFEGINANYAGSAFTAGGTFSNCTFKSMYGQYDTIGISNGGIITDCEIWNGKNTDGYGPGAANGGGVKLNGGVLRRCLVAGCYAPHGGGLRVNGGLVDACVISNCYSSTGMGGGVYQTSGVVSNSVITCNTQNSCRGVYMTGGTMVGCLITGNKGKTGGGVYKTKGTLRNCTVTANSITTANGGVVQKDGAIENCIIVYNGITDKTDDSLAVNGGTVTYTCAWNHPVAGAGNISADPMFADAANGDYRLNGASPCVDQGLNGAWGTDDLDLAGNGRLLDGNGDGDAVIDIGAFEYDPDKAPPACSFEVTGGSVGTGLPTTASFKAYTQGAVGTVNGYIWDFGDGTCVTSDTDTVSHEYTAFGVHAVTLSLDCSGGTVSPFSIPGAVSIKPAVVYVSTIGSDTPPYDEPAKATPDFNAAINMVAVPAGGLGVVHVAAGTYARAAAEEILVAKAVRLVGDEGAERTIVDGNRKSAQLLHVSHDDAVVEGITFDNKSFNQRVARLEKGTIRNCVLSGGNWNETGGIYMDNGMLENTIIRNSNSNDAGYGEGYSNGGFYIAGGTMRGCVVSNCTADCQAAGTIKGGTVTNCAFVLNSHGGGQASGVVRVLSGNLFNSRIVGNRSATSTGGVAGLFAKAGTVRNCLVADNASKGAVGLKAETATVESCTVANNVSSGEGYVAGVTCTGAAKLYNVLAWGNVGTATNSLGTATCTTCLFDRDPKFRNPARGDYRFRDGSPAQNAGTCREWMNGATDLNGNPRILNKVVDIGCCEVPVTGLMLIVR